jgi:putative addiction module antidote
MITRKAMTDTLKVRKVGNSSGVILPKSLLEEMGVEEGDELFAVREADGSLRLTPYDPDFAEAVEDAREFMDSHRNAFRELAK